MYLTIEWTNNLFHEFDTNEKRVLLNQNLWDTAQLLKSDSKNPIYVLVFTSSFTNGKSRTTTSTRQIKINSINKQHWWLPNWYRYFDIVFQTWHVKNSKVRWISNYIWTWETEILITCNWHVNKKLNIKKLKLKVTFKNRN